MKKRKLTLDDIEISSFVTTINDKEKITYPGGDTAQLADSDGFFCSWYLSGCMLTLNCRTVGQHKKECFTNAPILEICQTTQTAETTKKIPEFCQITTVAQIN